MYTHWVTNLVSSMTRLTWRARVRALARDIVWNAPLFVLGWSHTVLY